MISPEFLHSGAEDKMERDESGNGTGKAEERGDNGNPRDKGGIWAGGGRGQSHCETLPRHQAR